MPKEESRAEEAAAETETTDTETSDTDAQPQEAEEKPAQDTQEARIGLRHDNGTICSFGRFNGADSDSGGSPAPNLHSFATRRDMRRGVLDSFCRRAD